MGTQGDGLNTPPNQALALLPSTQPKVVVFVHDVERGRHLVGVRDSGSHAYRYQEISGGSEADPDQLS